MMADIMRGLRDVMLLSEKVKDTTELAKQADRRSLEVSERLARIEAVLDYALHGARPAGRPRSTALPDPDRD